MATKRSIMTLFSDPLGLRSHRVRLVMAEKKVAADVIDTDPAALHEDVIDLNPYGTLPTLVDRTLALYDSRIILEYLEERFPHPPLLSVDPVSRASFRLYMYRVEMDWYGLADVVLAKGRPAQKARKELKESLIASTPIIESKPYFMSNEFTLVDASIAPLLWRLPAMGIELTGKTGTAYNQYAARLFKREAFAASLSEAEKELRR